MKIINSFLPITWEPNEIETWDCCHCVCLRKAHRMMYNLTYLGQRVTLPWLDLRSNFDLDLSMFKLYMVRRAMTRQTRWYQNRCSTPLKLNILSSKSRFGKFSPPWPLVTSILTWANNWPLYISKRFCAQTYRTPFCIIVLRCAAAEIDGGCSEHTPPLQQVVENSEAHQGAN